MEGISTGQYWNWNMTELQLLCSVWHKFYIDWVLHDAVISILILIFVSIFSFFQMCVCGVPSAAIEYNGSGLLTGTGRVYWGRDSLYSVLHYTVLYYTVYYITIYYIIFHCILILLLTRWIHINRDWYQVTLQGVTSKSRWAVMDKV